MTALPLHMKGIQLTGHGGPDKLVFRDDIPAPTPGPRDVLIKVSAAGVNNTDINTRIGWYSKSVATATADAVVRTASEATDGGWAGKPFVFPRIQGTDVCGRIVAVGAGIAAERIGERVLVDPVLRRAVDSLENVGYVGLERDGGFAEFVRVPEAIVRRGMRRLSGADDLIGLTLAEPLACCYHGFGVLGLRAGDTVLIIGDGPMGLLQAALARQSQIEAYGVISNEAILPCSSAKLYRRSTGLPGKFPVTRPVTMQA